jgi:hypothetical protein
VPYRLRLIKRGDAEIYVVLGGASFILVTCKSRDCERIRIPSSINIFQYNFSILKWRRKKNCVWLTAQSAFGGKAEPHSGSALKTFLVRVTPDAISLQFCTPKVVGV